MAGIGRNVHASQRGPRGPRRGRSGVSAIAVTAVIAVLAVVVAMLSYKAATRKPSASSGDVSALEARLDELAGQLAAVQQTSNTALRDAKTSLAVAGKRPRPAAPAQPAFAACLTQMQREIDDLQAYLAYRTPPRRDRVSGACKSLLKPRFAAG